MKVIYFYHVPKCGGTFIKELLGRINVQTKNSYFLNLHTSFELQYGNIPNIINNISNLKYDYVYVYHHHSPYGIADILLYLKGIKECIKNNGGTFYLFTCIRESISYVTSYVNYINNHAGPAWPNSYKWNYDKAINAGWFNNYQTKYLLYNHAGFCIQDIVNYKKNRWPLSKQDILETLEIFDKIYTTESIQTVKKELEKIVPNVDSCWNNNKVNRTDHNLIITDDQKIQYCKNNKIDKWLYDLYGSAKVS